jgi:hypothetical protein
MYYNNLCLEAPVPSFGVLSIDRKLKCWPVKKNSLEKISFGNCGYSKAYSAFRLEVVINMA